MIVYVGFAQPDEWVGNGSTYAWHAERLAEASGEPCVTISYRHAGPDLMRRLAPSAVVLSGFGRSFEQYDPAEFGPIADYVEQAIDTHILAICGSHQLMGYLFNGTLRACEPVCDLPMRKRRPGEPIINADYHPEYIMERGFYELQVLEPDPLFEGCGDPPIVLESHYCEIKTLPPGFRLIASTPECRIQAMRHESRPLVSVQFHPEQYTDRFADGRQILVNFFKTVDG